MGPISPKSLAIINIIPKNVLSETSKLPVTPKTLNGLTVKLVIKSATKPTSFKKSYLDLPFALALCST